MDYNKLMERSKAAIKALKRFWELLDRGLGEVECSVICQLAPWIL